MMSRDLRLMSNTPSTLVCFAVKEEAKYFRRLLKQNPEIELLITGMGKRNAESAVTAALEKRRPQRLITAGFAGGLSPDLSTGTVVFSPEDSTCLKSELLAAGARPIRFSWSAEVVTTSARKQELHARTGAAAVEMESRIIMGICREHQIPAAIVRVVLDTAHQDLPLDFNRLMTSDQRLSYCKLMLHLLRFSWKIPALIHLQKQSVMAATRLSEVLGRVLTVKGYCK